MSIPTMSTDTQTRGAAPELEMNIINDKKLILNVGGVKYETFRSTLIAHPSTLLGTMFQDEETIDNKNEFFFDRDGKVFRYILQYYRNNKIYWPDSSREVSREELLDELEFFQISADEHHLFV
ncbi:15786_t:CDS:2, partial [Funneliformis geosporum]